MSDKDTSVVNGYDAIIADKIDLLFEKRKAVREAALTALYRTLSLRYCGTSVEARQETLVEALERVLRDHQENPTLFALRTVALAAITLPTGHNTFFLKIYQILKRIILDETQTSEAKTEAVNALAMTCFMSALFDVDHEMSSTSEVLTLFREFLLSKTRSIPADIACAVLQGWILLASTLPVSTVHDEIFSKYFTKISQFMSEDYDISLRVIAAQAVVILLELEKDYQKSDDESQEEQDLGDTLEKMSEVYDDKLKFKNKVEMKKQRATLKSLISFVENGITEEEVILIRNFPLVLNTWMQMFRMDRFKNYLGEGFMTHLEENRNLMYVFDYYVDVTAPVTSTTSKKQRRNSLQEISKAATKNRYSMRAIREQEVGYATE